MKEILTLVYELGDPSVNHEVNAFLAQGWEMQNCGMDNTNGTSTVWWFILMRDNAVQAELEGE